MDFNRVFEEGRARLRRLQRSDTKTKKRYLVLGSTLAMIFVVGLWFFYLNLTLPKVPGEGAAAAAPREVNANPSFLRVIGRGALNLKDDFVSRFNNFKQSLTESIQSLTNLFKEKKTFTIEP